MTNRIQRYLVLSGLILMFTLYPVGNTSLGLVLLLIGLLFGGARNPIPVKYVEIKLLMVFSMGMILSALFAQRPLESLGVALGQILIFYLVFWGADLWVKNSRWVEKYCFSALYLSAFISGVACIVTYLKAPNYWFRTRTFFTGVNGTGTVLMVAIALSLVFIFQQDSRKKKWIGSCLLMIPFIGILFTFSRGAYLGFVGMMFVYTLRSKKGAVFFLLFCLIVSSSLMMFSPMGRERFETFFTHDSGRFDVWETAVRMIQDRPILGVGPGMFSARFNDYKPPTVNTEISLAHNLELQLATEFGLLGLCVFLLFLGLVLKRNWELIRRFPEKNIYRGIFAALIAYLIHNQVDGTMVGVEIGSFFWLLSGFIVYEYYSVMRHTECGHSLSTPEC